MFAVPPLQRIGVTGSEAFSSQEQIPHHQNQGVQHKYHLPYSLKAYMAAM